MGDDVGWLSTPRTELIEVVWAPCYGIHCGFGT